MLVNASTLHLRLVFGVHRVLLAGTQYHCMLARLLVLLVKSAKSISVRLKKDDKNDDSACWAVSSLLEIKNLSNNKEVLQCSDRKRRTARVVACLGVGICRVRGGGYLLIVRSRGRYPGPFRGQRCLMCCWGYPLSWFGSTPPPPRQDRRGQVKRTWDNTWDRNADTLPDRTCKSTWDKTGDRTRSTSPLWTDTHPYAAKNDWSTQWLKI